MSALRPTPALRRPPPLRPGDAVHLVAPAGRYDPTALARGVAVLEAAGLRPRAPAPMVPFEVYAGDDAARADALRSALDDDACAAVWTVRGGSGTARLLPHVEATLARALGRRGRWLVGFSDVTALHARFAAHGWQSLHAANVVNLADWHPKARAHLFSALGLGAAPNPVHAGVVWAGPVPRQTGGWLVGGNLTVLASTLGCGVLPDWEGAVLVLEDVAEAPYRLDRALAQLVLAGALRGVRAVVWGQLTRCGDPARVQALVSATLRPLGVPVVGGFAFGHEASSHALPLGAYASLESLGSGRVALTVAPA